ncbi:MULTISPECIES: SUMF1/EgtB/PvdO family nonheme iron enzyme [Bradyrhizobium]|jgi:formylglycine-generating enzyme required for sulfatase activity|uniref:Formylglycine-generating enzyme, required for sulfatase activity, contains SUMF1/FGE domain n=2 Tax=Bradyrhizobium TaxID=374 RepID=A0ABY0QGC1_9BRAD|nr:MULTISPECIES: SUMF1/EgtB/PvdO family nonheme iron enzyme [Bradyrhizobium]SDK27563.1 Formylglycine-generating enzyme, required for sulfatase activity, contains SUMF1/FGE domain [Bradyrhizobium ottawaense]SEE42722.1 Formylglycine-generating enzyme, required for sulfatase activity, contains SUMF1/FGE domain [Bradyrhizobium lablabi]SHM41495.1 Formylglycine-generating enzyme, required for sulfatase activity, contains SUMF1/FGE domain [Bradyrhizobium lablabi]
MLIAFKIKFALACAAGLAGPLAVAPLVMENSALDANLRDRQAIVELHSGSSPYRVNGDFTHAGKQASAPLIQVSLPKPLAIMKHQVSSTDYQACVDDGACRALDRGVVVAADRPAVQISWHDANGYAAWLSRKSGETWRLPTDEEWAFAAGSKFKDDGIVIDDNDPSKRWIARYEREADRAPSDPGTRSFGSFGSNENGLQDVGGNVWEWTASCFVRRVLDDAGKVVSESPNCGVRVVEGQHRAYVTDFIRDAKAGGCAVGVPPNNLGFRLVVERDRWPGVQHLVSRVKALL